MPILSLSMFTRRTFHTLHRHFWLLVVAVPFRRLYAMSLWRAEVVRGSKLGLGSVWFAF